MPNSICRAIEVNMGIWAACAPMMKPFSRYIRARFFQGDSRILHPSKSSLSFWHRSWWRPSKYNTSRKESDTSPPPLPPKSYIDTQHSETLEKQGKRRVRRKFRIPSLLFGDDFQNRIANDSRLDTRLRVDVADDVDDETYGETDVEAQDEKVKWPLGG